MSEKPILFSAPMVQALLNGTKTQTRRVIKPQPLTWETGSAFLPFETIQKRPYGNIGDRLWVRETWKPHCEGPISEQFPIGTCVKYRADGAMMKPTLWTEDQGGWCEAHEEETKWRPSIFMPRWASRITLEITGVRVGRLQDISEQDAVAEGIESNPGTYSHERFWKHYGANCHLGYLKAAESYRTLWESINGPGSWDKNPWVWVIEFRKI